MNVVSIQLGDLILQSPGAALTNLALAGQAGWFALLLVRRNGSGSRVWAGIFVGLSAAAALGVPKHALPHLLGPVGTVLVRGGSNLALCAAVTCFMLGAIQRHARRPWTLRLAHFLTGLLAGLGLAVNVHSQDMGPTGLLLAAGMVPVVVAETLHARRSRHAGGPALGIGLWIAAMGGMVFALGFSPSPWLTRTDLAHVAFLLALPWVYRGARNWLDGVDPTGRASWS